MIKVKSIQFLILLVSSFAVQAQEWWDINIHQGSGTNSNTIFRDIRPVITNGEVRPPNNELKKLKDGGSAKDTKAAKKRMIELEKERQAAFLMLESEEKVRGVPALNCSYCFGVGIQNCQKCLTTGFNECVRCNGDGEQRCRACRGSGTIRDLATCAACKGTGQSECISCIGKGKVTCSSCSGVGYGNCEHCLGAGKQFNPKEQKFQNIMEADSVFSSSSKKKGDRKIKKN